MVKCCKCKTRIKQSNVGLAHVWIVKEDIYCSASCERGGKSQFEKTYKALKDMKRSKKSYPQS